jgi:MtN3 and saliva related transmembrane protein
LNHDIIGYLAAFFTTVAFIPQAYKIFKTNQTADLSLSLFFIYSLGVSMWLLYGILLHSIPMTLANSISLSLSLYILYKKITQDYLKKVYNDENCEEKII